MMKLKRSIYYVLCLILGVCSLSSCIEEFEADLPAEDSEVLVVEGAICSGKMNKFILSRTQAIRSYESPRMVSGANVSVRGSDGSEIMAHEVDGYYACNIDALSPDVTYYLHIETGGEVYESEPQKPIRTEKIEDVRGVQNTPTSDIDVLVTPAAPFEADHANYYSWTYDETWEVHANYSTHMYFDVETMTRVYKNNLFPEIGWKDATSSTIIVGGSPNYEGQHIQRLKMYDLSRDNERMYFRYSALVHQRAISKAEYEYELARRQAGSEMGGLFTPQPSSLPTNIRCLTSSKNVIGFVGCSLNTSEYRFFLNAEDFSIAYPKYEDQRVWLENCTEEACCKMVEKGYFLCEWEDERISFGPLRTAWAKENQLDVRYKGAYIEEPDFWSLTENVSY
jgi:hypothetical protein